MNGTERGPTLEEIRECEETIEVNAKALERLHGIVTGTYPQNAYDRAAISEIFEALE